MEGHPDRLQGGGTEPVDGRTGHGLRQAGQERRAAGQVHSLLVLREPAADHHVDDVLSRQVRDASQRGVDRERDEVVRPRVDERALPGAADRRARCRNDDGFRHALLHRDRCVCSR